MKLAKVFEVATTKSFNASTLIFAADITANVFITNEYRFAHLCSTSGDKKHVD